MRLLYIFIIFNIFIFSENLFSKELSEREKFDNLSKEISNWGRWGANDQLGTLNNISDSNIINAKKLVIEGKTISLSRNMSKESNEEIIIKAYNVWASCHGLIGILRRSDVPSKKSKTLHWIEDNLEEYLMKTTFTQKR